ncbi:hypothetical protein DL769_007652 [Monosporascus sp. CRB-8-3]|nr:hypothetical protein DL769_007652 [Monosporascus sp. CRB-8-3]
MATVTWEEIKGHNTEADAWIVVHGIVYNATKFLEDHPGGKEIILEVAGQDATDVFEEAGHSTEARDILPKLLVGRVEDYRNEVQSFDSIISAKARAEEGKGSWTKAIIAAVLPLVIFASLPYLRAKLLGIWSLSLQNLTNSNPLLVSAVVILALSLGAFCTFTSYIIYVDYGRLEKYPSRVLIE